MNTSPLSVVVVLSYQLLYNVSSYFFVSIGPLFYVEREIKSGFLSIFPYHFNSWYFKLDLNQNCYNLGRRSNKILDFFF